MRGVRRAALTAAHSAIFTGWVRHRRRLPKEHSLRVGVYMMYLDLAELPRLFRGRWLWSCERWNVASFFRRDYLGASGDLAGAVREAVRGKLGACPDGAIRVLTNIRSFGLGFNPVTFYYCFDRDEKLGAVVAEITNTPWGERHTYVSGAADSRGLVHADFDKEFHVSPFMPMDQRYRWLFTTPGAELLVHMKNSDARGEVFDATLRLSRRELAAGWLAWVLVRYPLMSVFTLAMIYLHAAFLWLKGVPSYIHPGAACEARAGADARNAPHDLDHHAQTPRHDPGGSARTG